MTRKTRWMIAATLAVGAVVLIGQRPFTPVHADQPKASVPAGFKKLVEEGRLPPHIKEMSERVSFGKVQALWPTANGLLYFTLSTPNGATGFLLMTGDLKGEAMVKVLLLAQEKQLVVGAYTEHGDQLVGGVVLMTP